MRLPPVCKTVAGRVQPTVQLTVLPRSTGNRNVAEHRAGTAKLYAQSSSGGADAMLPGGPPVQRWRQGEARVASV
jgi:hypothetical protein